MRRRVGAGALVLGALLAVGCGGRATREPGRTALLKYSNANGEAARVVIDGVEIEIAPDVKEDLSFLLAGGSRTGSTQTTVQTRIHMGLVEEAQADDTPGSRFWLRGQRLVVEDGLLRLGTTSYGEVSAGDDVRIDAEGVHVGGRLRGALPG